MNEKLSKEYVGTNKFAIQQKAIEEKINEINYEMNNLQLKQNQFTDFSELQKESVKLSLSLESFRQQIQFMKEEQAKLHKKMEDFK